MIALFFTSLLFFFNSYNLGFLISAIVKRKSGKGKHDSLFEIFISGIILTFVYVSVISLFCPANFYVLIPLFFVSIIICYRYSTLLLLLHRLAEFWKRIKRDSFLFVIFPTMGLFFIYWIIPPINADSAAYHYLSIEWFEQFKIIPGLANIHGRFAFNPASFIISAPYCFTDIFQQAIYPVNGVVIVSFFIWFGNLIMRTSELEKRLLFVIVMAFWLRLSLVNISSPSSDALAITLATFVMIKVFYFFNSTKNRLDLPVHLLIFTGFCVTVKLSLLPMILLIPLVIWWSNITTKSILYSISLLLIIFLPWLIRNFILSGYFLYPLIYSGFNFYTPDWKVPNEVIYLDRIYTKYGPYYLNGTVEWQMGLNFFQRNILWIASHFKNRMYIEFFLLTAALLSPVYWIVLRIKRIVAGSLFWMWALVYGMVILWIINSPDYRFGSVYLYTSVLIPAFYLLKYFFTFKQIRKLYLMLFLGYPLLFCYYSYRAFAIHSTYIFTVNDIWFLPLKDIRYMSTNGAREEKLLLNDKTTVLYFANSACECINLPQPCMPWKYGKVEMRGKEITNGFKNVENNVKTYYPFVARPF